jgi:hypothetical protein
MNKDKHYDIATIKETLKIWDVLKCFGYEVQPKCGLIKSPIRGEAHPSFSIYDGGKKAKDHSSGDQWNVIDLYAHLDQCSVHEAIVGCGQLAGLQGSETPNGLHVPPPPPSSLPAKPTPQREKSYVQKLPQLTRKLVAEMSVAAHASINNDSSPLSVFAANKGLTKKTIIKAINKGMIGVLNPIPDMGITQPVIVWLFKDWAGNLGAKIRFDPLSSRKTIWWQGQAKEFLFGDVATCKSELEDFSRPPIFVTEGESDALTVLQLGCPVLGIVGANTIPTTPKLHAYFSHRSVGIIYDSDKAGVKSSSKLADHITQTITGSTIYNLTNSGLMDIRTGSDINEAMRDHGISLYKQKMKLAHDLISHQPNESKFSMN